MFTDFISLSKWWHGDTRRYLCATQRTFIFIQRLSFVSPLTDMHCVFPLSVLSLQARGGTFDNTVCLVREYTTVYFMM